MARTTFENLRVYRLAEELSDDVWDLVATWPAFAQHTVGEQLVDAADSIGANIAEGTGRGTFKDNRRFVYIARGSLYETKHFLRRAFRRGLLKPERIEQLKAHLDELSPKLNAYLNSIPTSPPRRTQNPKPPIESNGNQQLTTNNEPLTTNYGPNPCPTFSPITTTSSSSSTT